MAKIVIKIGRDGSRKVEAFGFKGPECKEKTKFLDQVFGLEKEDELKPSYYEDPDTNTLLDIEGLPGGGRFCG